MPILEASHSISSDLVKFGSVKMDVLVNFSFKVSKTFACSCPHLNITSLFTISLRGTTIVLKFFTNLL